jgi:predicted secreted protein
MARAMSALDIAFDSVALEDEVSTASLDFSVPESEITSFSDSWQNFLAGKPTATLAFSGSADLASGQGDITIFGELGQEAEEYDFEPDGTTGYNGFGIITSYSIKCNINEAIKYDCTLRHAGGSTANDGNAPTRG